MPTPHSLLGPPAEGHALNLALSASAKHTLFSLLYRVRERFPEQVQCTGLRPGTWCHPGPFVSGAALSPGTPSLSAGLCLCWLGLPPILPGLGDRGRTHRVSSHWRSTGRARAPPAEAATRLPHRHPPPSHPLAMNLGSLGGSLVLCSYGPRPRSLASLGEENVVTLWSPLSFPFSPKPAGAMLCASTGDKDESTLGPGAQWGRQACRTYQNWLSRFPNLFLR